jgi:hypothetical protein
MPSAGKPGGTKGMPLAWQLTAVRNHQSSEIQYLFGMKSFLLPLCLSLLCSCNEANMLSLDEEKTKILQIHHAQRAYHFSKDSIAFANQLSGNFISVSKGKIRKPTMAETISRYHGYFSSVEFTKWDDLAEPIIQFSDDGTMAYTIVDKIVALSYPDENGNPLAEETHFAWTTIYRKYGDEWKIDCVTSTEEEGNR